MAELLLVNTVDGVRTLTLNRPERSNALSPELQAALRAALADAAADPEVRVVVLTGAGDKVFSAGADLGSMNADVSFLDKHGARSSLVGLFLELLRFPKPTVCRANGHVLAGAVGLMLACDLVVAAEDASFSTPEIARGIFPYMISALIVRNVGRKKAFELMLLGEKWTAAQAREAGLINWAVPRHEIDAATGRVARRLAGMSPLVLRMGKAALTDSAEMDLDGAMKFLLGQLSMNLTAEDAAEGVAAFLDKREPKWRGR